MFATQASRPSGLGKRAAGFTLVELLVALGVAAVLSAIAVPSYRQVVQRALRQDARLALLRIQGQQERHFTQHLRYAGRLQPPIDAEGLGLEPLSEGGGYRLFLRADDNGLGYTATARATGRQADDNDCALLWLDQSGQRGSEDAAGRPHPPGEGRCWN
jgi:type IV pilus assembly protein PilE